MMLAGVGMTEGLGLLRGSSRLTSGEGADRLIYLDQLLITDRG